MSDNLNMELDSEIQPIIFQNKPIETDDKDIFDFTFQKKVLNTAIDKNARIIGIIGDYGTGKSSITKLLEKERLEKNDRVININLWDQFSKNNNPETQKISTDDSLIKSFLYQLAFANKKRNVSFAKYINARFNKNNGKIGFAFATRKTFILLSIAAFFFISFFSINSFNQNYSIITEIESINSLSKWEIILFTLINGRYLFWGIAIAFLIWGIIIASPVFSSWKSEGNYSTSNSDIYEIYLKIIKRLKSKRKRKTIVCIDDLDRTANKIEVVSFLKEIYKCVHLLPDELQRQIVFIISLKAEIMLNLENDETVDKSNSDFVNVYPKIFDYTLNIKQIHNENYRDVILELLEHEKEAVFSLFNRINTEKLDDENILVKVLNDLKWIYNDENVTIRELKERLNETFLLFQTLLARSYENPSIQLKKCAAVTFLKRKYENEYNAILEDERKFAKLIRDCNKITDKNTITNLLNENDIILEKGNKFFDSLKTIILEGSIEDDFLMYCYSYPKRSYIKNSMEKDVFDALIHDDFSFLEKEDSTEIVKKVVFEKKGKVVDEAFNKYLQSTVPLIVYSNEDLFTYIIKKFSIQKKIISEGIIKTLNLFIADKNHSVKQINNVLNFKFEDSIKKELLKIINENVITNIHSLKAEEIDVVRINFLSSFSTNLEMLIPIFTNDSLPLFSRKFFEKIEDEKIVEQIIKNLSDTKLSEFDESGNILPDNKTIEDFLYSKHMIISLLLSYAEEDKLEEFDFSCNWIGSKLEEVTQTIYELNEESFVIIRKTAKKQIENLSDNFYKIYNGDYPLITEEELKVLMVDELYDYLNHSLITIDNCDFLSEYCNERNFQAKDLYCYFKALFLDEYKISDDKVIKQIFTGINFTKIKFDSLTVEQQKEIFPILEESYSLNTVDGTLNFMKRTNCLISSLEEKFVNEIKADTVLFDKYLELINYLECASNITLDIIKDKKIKVPLHPNITEFLLANKFYIRYIIGKTLYDKKLTLNEEITLDKYYNVFKTSDECYEYFKQNNEIIDKFYDVKSYLDYNTPAEKLEVFYSKRQPIDLIKTVLSKWSANTEKQKEYLFQIIHIDTEFEVWNFIDLITQPEYVHLLDDPNLFYYLWYRMWHKSQKIRFTTKVNRILKTSYNAGEAYKQ